MCITEGVRLSNLLVCQFSMVGTMDTTIPPKLIIKVPNDNKTPRVDGSGFLSKSIPRDTWGIKERKKRMGPIALNELILNRKTGPRNAPTANHTMYIPRFAHFAQTLSSLFDHRVDIHLSNISCSCAGFKYMTRGCWHITPRLWTRDWTMTNMLQGNPMASIGLTGKLWVAL